MNYLDICILIPLIWAFYKGFKKGLIFEIATLLALILGLFFGYRFAVPFSDLIAEYLKTTPTTSTIISFIVVFIAIVLTVFLIGKIIESVINLIALGFFNKLMGALFGIVKITLVISFILYGLNSFGDQLELIPVAVKKDSLLYQPICSFSAFLLTFI